MNDFQVYSVITTDDLKNKGFIIHPTYEDIEKYYFAKVSKGDVDGYVCFTRSHRVDSFPERDLLFAQELCKAFPDIWIVDDNQFFEIMHMQENEENDKRFKQMVQETVNYILSYDPSQHKFEPMRDPEGNPIMPPIFELGGPNSPEGYQDDDDECDSDIIVTNDNNKTMPCTQPLFK